VLAADRDREGAATALREHYVRGRLTLDELSARTERVLTARSRADLRAALAGLPPFPGAGELASAARHALRGAMVVAFTGVYLIFSLLLALVLGVTLLVHGASSTALIGFLVVWLVPTYLWSRLFRRGRPDRRV
jgi:Flp pilus assembly protein TadB